MKSNIKFYDLAPMDNLELGIYEEAIDFSLKNDKIKNIAISGGYGAGKSSLLESYKKNSEKKFLHISLAHFKDFDDKDKDGRIALNNLEAKILNQLIHQIDPKDIFQTNFKIKRKITKNEIIITTLLLLTFFLFSLNLIYSEKWEKFIIYSKLKKFFQFTTKEYFKLTIGIVLLIILGIFIYEVLKLHKAKGFFRKLNIQGNEIDIAEDNNDSYFDKYLNEVLYLFQESNVDVIVFEDIDRYEIGEIFERLREINSLVNNKLKKENKILKFLYLLKDDIFISKDRTKFFDFIIPIIPVMDSSNSYDKILELFGKEYGEELDKYFLQDISLYIDDMRLLKNIYNEFQIYYKKLGSIEINCSKMLGIIIYKNLFPRDFSALHLNQGFIYSLFGGKEKIIQNEIERINKKINILKDKIEEIKSKVLEREDLEYIKRKKQQELNNYSSHYRESMEEYKWINEEYPKRIELLEILKNGKIDKIQEEISSLESHKNKVLNRNLKEIITRENIDEIFETNEFEEVKENQYFKLLKYLVRSGNLDETYSDYMTYFYENSLFKEDKIFLRSVSDKEKKEYSYKLKNPDLIIERLSERSFEEIEVFNFDLLKTLLNKKYEKKLTYFLLLLKETQNFEFIREFFNLNTNEEKFVQRLNYSWSENVSHILEGNLFSEDEKHRYSLVSLYTSTEDLLTSINTKNILKNYIENKENYLEIAEPKISKISSAFKKLGIKFKSINYDVSNNNLFKEIYENSMYELNFNNISLMLKIIFGINSEEDIKNKNYTLICANRESSLYQYVNINIELYIREILINTDLIEDKEEVAIEVLNNGKISPDNKDRYLDVLNTIINDISNVREDIWDKLIEKEKIEYSENNIVAYFQKEKELNELLINFINLGKNKLSFKGYSQEIGEKLFDTILICNDVKNDIYKEIIESLEWHYAEGGIPLNIKKEKMDILIELKVIRMTPKNLKEVRENYIENLVYYIKSNIEEYVKIMEKGLFFQQELNDILLDDEIDEQLKLELLKFSEETIYVRDKDYSSNILKYILENNFDENELRYLIENYSKYEEVIKDKIFELTIERLNEFSENIKEISPELVKRILVDDRINSEVKIEFLNGVNEVKYLKKYFKYMGLKEYNGIFNKNSEIKVEKSDFNYRVLEKLKNDNLIDNFNEEGLCYIVKTKREVKQQPFLD
ncbi:MAG: hypothetical protein RR523_08165 [Cetobacterium sp.]|uniref:YobI family P-loop NTPase n=1 Tax=Cetobacterium sp. TaxID=2071632 RepID=UPI002FCB489A